MTFNSTGVKSSQQLMRQFVVVLVLAPVLFLAIWECCHYVRYGDFFTYGYHTDLVEDHSDIGVPRLHAAYCLRVTNYTFFSLKFEGHQWPSGTTDSEITLHDRLEKWDQQSRSWSTVFDHGEDSGPSGVHANIAKTVRPGQSIYPSGCYEVATVEGVHAGDVIRIVAFTSYSSSTARAVGQHAFYSPPLRNE
jgi:hypothetical protein